MSSHQLLDYRPPPDAAWEPLWLDDHLLVVDKPSGLLSVPGRGAAFADCMASRVQQRYPDALIVHRLDMDTSGLLLMARGKDMQRRLSELFLRRDVHKRYVAVLQGVMTQAEGLVDLPLITDWPNRPRQKVDHELGKPSQTRYWVRARDEGALTTRVELEPITGRSHQLRVHMQAIGYPIVGDPLYASQAEQWSRKRLHLHAAFLSFQHPVTGALVEVSREPDF
ncbi:MAG TPA: RluA family pseudouridine synthase [Aquabacterium sp.]|nr:RluA family pseudouridine synthase [Aquabacterium sp.]